MDREELVCAECGCVIDKDSNYITLESGEVICEECAEHYIQCADCGEWIHEDDSTIVNKHGQQQYVCEDCLNNNYIECEECGEYFYEDDMNTAYKNGWEVYVCDQCLYDDYEQCDWCGDYEHIDNIQEAYDENGRRIDVCDGCIENHFVWCDNCERYVHEDYYNYEQDCCYDCESSGDYRVKEYHNRPRLQYYGNAPKNWKKWHGIGIELEVDDGEEQSDAIDDIQKAIGDEFVYFNHDGSLGEYGFEIISQPSTYEYFKKQNWKGVLDACKNNGYKSHDAETCGLHVHLSREYFGNTKEEQDRAISKLVLFYNYFYDDIITISRRRYSDAQQWANKYGADYEDLTQDDAKQLVKSKDHTRYRAVNLTNTNTIEIRIMRGTLNYKSFMACIDFVVKTAIMSKTIAYRDVNDFNKWIKNIDESTKEYIKSRGIQLEK